MWEKFGEQSKQMKRHFQCAAGPSMIRESSEHDPTMIRPWNRQSATRLATEVTFHAHHEHSVLKNTTCRAPAIIPNFTEYCACHEKWHFNFTKYCTCHEKWHLNFAKYCTCHAKWLSWSILFTHETLFTMRGLTSVIVQTHQILRLPRKITLMINPLHTWNAIYNARSNKCHFPNSPNTAPATQNNRPKCERNLVNSENRWNVMSNARPIREWSEHDPTMIRAWSDHETVSPQPASQPRFLFTPTTSIFCFEKYNISHSGYHSKFHRILRLPRKVTLQLHQILRLPRKVTLELQQIEPLLDWAMTSLSYYLTELWLDWAMTWLSYYLTELWLDWAITWPSYYFLNYYFLTELWLDWAITWLSYDLTELWLDWAITWLSYYLTELLLDWAITWLSYDLTELLLDWAIAWLSYDLTELLLDRANISWLSSDLTELLLDWAITWLSYDLTELWLDWATTWLSYDLTELWLDWAMTWLSYYLTELWLDWAMTWLSYDLTELLNCDLIRISEVSQLNFLWLWLI